MTQYYRLRWDWERGSQFYNHPRTGKPGILNFLQLQHNNLNEAWQRFWFSLNTVADYNLSVKAWNGYTSGNAFLTDGYGTDYFRNYITGENLSKGYPKIETKGCVGNVVCGVGEPVRLWQGWLWLRIETLDITKPPPVGMTYQTHPHLIHHATVSAGSKCNPFPHLGGRNTGRPVYFPVTSKGAVYYPLKYLQKLPLGSLPPNPYYPAMKF
jgi:hypothetical protein